MTRQDFFCNGRLICGQPDQGYRFSLDPVLLANFCSPGERDSILDLGTGCGVLGLLLAHRFPGLRVTGLELQEALLEHARENVRQNGFTDRFRVLAGDFRQIRELLPAESFDLVVSNPPYGKLGAGRLNCDNQCAMARHAMSGDLDDVIRAAAFAVRNRGRACFVFPAARLMELIVSCTRHRLWPGWLRPVYNYPGGGNARLVLLKAVKNGRCQLALQPPLYIHAAKNGAYSQEVAAYYEGA